MWTRRCHGFAVRGCVCPTLVRSAHSLDSSPDGGAAAIGAVAQLGERMNRTHEVRGSIPLSSTESASITGISLSDDSSIARDRMILRQPVTPRIELARE